MNKTLTALSLTTLLLTGIAYLKGGTPLVREGLSNALGTSLQALPLVIAAFILIGQLQVLLSTDFINKWLQKFTHSGGILFSSAAGGLFPGPPYVYYPFIASLKEKGLPFYIFFSFIIGKQIYDFARIPMEVSLINPGIALLRYLITLPFPFIMGFLSRYVFTEKVIEYLFGKGNYK